MQEQPTAPRVCEWCKATFSGTPRALGTCSDRCYHAAYHARNRDKQIAQSRARYQNNKAAILAQQKVWYQANKERIRAEARERYRLNYAEIRAKAVRYEIANKERRARQHKAWLQANRERTRAYDRARHACNPIPKRQNAKRRKALKRGNTAGPVDYKAIIAASGNRCGLCKKKVAVKERSFDHIIPLSHGGPHVQWNIQLTHLWCNLSRGPGRIPAQIRLDL